MATASDTPCLSEIGGILTNPNRNISLIPSSRPCNRSTIRSSPYTPQATAAFAIAITSMMILTIVGNILVIIAVLTSRSLKGPQNLFLVSLAAADILVATLIIPFSLANELQGYWAFSILWCEIYLALDVLFCTSSIVHLCAIALDRYLSISKPVSYGAKRTPSRIKAAIIVVWLISAVISFPPLLTLDKSEGGGEVCELNNERWYILYSTIGSFFAPCVIMILVYVRIYQIAKQHTRNPPGQKKPDVAGGEENPGKAVIEIPAKISEPSQHNGDQGIMSTSHPEKITTRIPTSDSTPSSFQSVPAKCQNATDNPLNSGKISAVRKSISSPSISIPHHREIHQIPSTVPNAKKPTEVFQNNTSSSSSDYDQEKDIAAPEVLQEDIEKNRQKKLDDRDRTSGLKGHVLSLAAKYKNTLATSSGTKLSSEESPKLQGTPISRRKAMVNREKRFTFVLAVVMGGFVICWFPFFFSYSLMAVCPDACSIPNPLFKFFFWIGYCNSCLNPVIYTIFNHDFRKAFKRILCRDIKGTFF